MKSTGIDANSLNENMASVLWVPLLFILLRGPTLVFAQDTSGPSATIKILPEYTEQAREGDSVTLECEIHGSSIQLTDYVLWTRRSSLLEPQSFIVKENGLTSNPDNRFSVSPLQVINSTASLYSHQITIDPVQQSDEGFYQCFVNSDSSGTYGTVVTANETTLLVHHPDEFPVCVPDGPATVTIGSSLSCKTLSDTRTPAVSEMGMPNTTNVGWVTSPTNGGGSPGQQLTKTVTNSEHGKTFHCFSLSNSSAEAVSCNIGPLTIVTTASSETTAHTTMNYTAPYTEQSVGLSGADIAGIVIGVILLIIIIAVHTLCCRCNPKRWMYTKSYPFNLSSSFGTSRARDNTLRTQPELELGNSEPQTNNLYSGSQASMENDTGRTIDNLQPAPTPDPSASEHSDPRATDPQPKPPAIYAQVNKTIPETDTKEPTKPKPPAVYAQVNKTIPETGTKESTKSRPPVVYTQVNKTIPETDTSELINPQPNPPLICSQDDKMIPQDDAELPEEPDQGSSKPQKIKNIKRFGQNSNGQVSRPPKPEPVIIYSALDLKETGEDEVRRPPPDSQTIYAEIKHYSPE